MVSKVLTGRRGFSGKSRSGLPRSGALAPHCAPIEDRAPCGGRVPARPDQGHPGDEGRGNQRQCRSCSSARSPTSPRKPGTRSSRSTSPASSCAANTASPTWWSGAAARSSTPRRSPGCGPTPRCRARPTPCPRPVSSRCRKPCTSSWPRRTSACPPISPARCTATSALVRSRGRTGTRQAS